MSQWIMRGSMGKRSITDAEIALIKAMLKRGMANKEIQFFFNRPERPVNSGRISNIKSGTYSDSAAIEPAGDDVLDGFLQNFSEPTIAASISIPASGVVVKHDGPCSEATLRALFEMDAEGNWRFRYGESDKHECKEDFSFKHTGKWLRAVAALANHNGGYIIFGVKDKTVANGVLSHDSYKVMGLKGNHFENADPADFTKFIRATFDPTPRVESRLLDLGTVKIGILYVHQHQSRPVVAQKGDGEQVREGDIFYRYPGQSARIKYSDLRAILDERDRQAREQILPMVERLLSAGPKGVMVADLSEGVITDEKRSIVIGEDLLERIQFIREGEFDEIEGGTTLRLVGDVQAVDETGNVVRKGFVTPADLIGDFLAGDSPYDPKDYIRCVVQIGGGAWLPLHYYAKKAGLDRKALAEFIADIPAPPMRKQTYTERALGHSSAYKKAAGESAKLLKMMEMATPEPANSHQAVDIARALAGLEDKSKIALSDALEMLSQCWTILSEKRPSWLTFVRKAVSRVDEVYFGEL